MSAGVPCPKCGSIRAKCTNSRPMQGKGTRRRYECKDCGERYTTAEVVVALSKGAHSVAKAISGARFNVTALLNAARMAMAAEIKRQASEAASGAEEILAQLEQEELVK